MRLSAFLISLLLLLFLAYLIHRAQILEEGFGPGEQGFVLRADDDIAHVALGAERV